MTGATKCVLSMAVALLAAGVAHGASDQLVPGTQLKLTVSASGRQKLSFQSKGTLSIPVPGSADDPSHAGATLQLFNPNTNESFTFALPSTHWSASASGSSFKYRDKVPVESGEVAVAVIGGRQLKVSGRKIGITLNEPSQGALGVVLTSGSFQYCALFSDGSVRVDKPGSFSAKNAPPPMTCPMAATTTTTTATTSTSTTVRASSTTTTTTVTLPITTTTVTIPLPPLGMVVLTIEPGTTDCGGPSFFPAAAAPFSGEADGTSGKIGDLGLGCLYIGGGRATALPPVGLADGATSVLNVTGISGLTLTLGGSPGSGPADCTQGPGPGMHCLNGTTGTDGMGACASDADCGGQVDSCALDANCFFGPPLPQPNPGSPPTSTCIVNAIAQDVTGSADLTSGGSTANAALRAQIYLTGDATSPCPQCVSGVCTAGARQGLACSGGIGSKNTSVECPPDPLKFVGTLTPTLALSTGTSSLTDPAGNLCADQFDPGAFGRLSPRTVSETGSPLLSGGISNLFATTLAGVFCVPASGSSLVNTLADLPGPAAVSVPGMISVQVAGLPLP
jgi:hypothetical protein